MFPKKSVTAVLSLNRIRKDTKRLDVMHRIMSEASAVIMKIRIIRDSETVRYAAKELKKYLCMVDSSISAEILFADAPRDGAINLGLLGDLGLSSDGVADAATDDLVDVKIDSLDGYIAGSNDRSVLFGVYKFLKSLGCRWVRPGKKGEYIPTADAKSHSFSYRKMADYPFRGQAIEGAVSFENVRDTILWLPKVDMNLFMIEQIVPYNYMSRWYKHTANTRLPHDDIPYEDYCEYSLTLEKLVKKCGLQLHALGHGALNEALGIRYKAPGMEYTVPEETKEAFALVNGERKLFNNHPMQTQLCMSQKWVRDKVVNWTVDYMKDKPYIDFMHFWLADSINNHCECDDCKKKTPSDWYVDILNELDARLTECKNDAKIVFIMYVDTLWPPISEKLNNPSRFIVTTACGSGKGYSAKRREGGIPEWKRNDFSIVGGLDMSLTFMDGWKPIFDGPSFVYEYLFYTDHFADPGYMTFTRKVASDAKALSVTGFDGIMSDQTQRCYFPTGLPQSAFGEFLFDTAHNTEEYIDGYLADAFGGEWKEAKAYLEKISASFDLEAMTQRTDVTAQDTGSVDVNSRKAGIIGNEAVGNVIATVPETVDAFAPTVERNLNIGNECHRESWRILHYHGNYCKGISAVYFALSRNDIDGAKAAYDRLHDYLSEIEDEIKDYFDLCLFNHRTTQIIKGK